MEQSQEKPIRVLLVEDGAINKRVTLRLLERNNCTVTIATNGKQGAEEAKNHLFDLIIMDCQMPVMDGYESSRLIRANEKGDKHIPIVALTALGSADQKEKCLAAGMDDYLMKPIHEEDLRALLAKLRKA